jgi:hypothetical protein
MLSAQTAAALAAGSALKGAPVVPVINVEVLRAFYWTGSRVEVGTNLAIDKPAAAELVSAGKARVIQVRPGDALATSSIKTNLKEKARAER